MFRIVSIRRKIEGIKCIFENVLKQTRFHQRVKIKWKNPVCLQFQVTSQLLDFPSVLLPCLWCPWCLPAAQPASLPWEPRGGCPGICQANTLPCTHQDEGLPGHPLCVPRGAWKGPPTLHPTLQQSSSSRGVISAQLQCHFHLSHPFALIKLLLLHFWPRSAAAVTVGWGN